MSTQRTRERNSDGQFVKTEKRQRVPFGGHRLKMQLSQEEQEKLRDKGYVAHWFNDVDGRIQRAEAGGYEFVMPEEATSIGQGTVHGENSDLNGKVSQIVSKGGGNPVRAFLMKIKKEWYDEDQATKEARNAATDEALSSGQHGGTQVENQYTPRGARNAISGITT